MNVVSVVSSVQVTCAFWWGDQKHVRLTEAGVTKLLDEQCPYVESLSTDLETGQLRAVFAFSNEQEVKDKLSFARATVMRKIAVLTRDGYHLPPVEEQETDAANPHA